MILSSSVVISIFIIISSNLVQHVVSQSAPITCLIFELQTGFVMLEMMVKSKQNLSTGKLVYSHC